MTYKIYANKKTKVAHRAGKRGDACRQSAVLKQKGIIYLTPARKYENIRASKRVARATNSDNPKPQPD